MKSYGVHIATELLCSNIYSYKYAYTCIYIIIRYIHIDTCISVDAKKSHKLMKNYDFNNAWSKKRIFRS